MGDRLRLLWDFDDLDVSERRLRARLEAEDAVTGRAEVLTQLARAEALRGRFDEGEELLRQAEALDGSTPVVQARVALERGRLLRSRGDGAAALPLFEAAYGLALDAGEDFIAADAAHMAAITTGDHAAPHAWTQRGIELAESSEEARYWLGPLLNNLGWHFYEAEEYEQALGAFRGALAAREADPERPYEAEIARYAVAKTLRALGRAAEAAPLLEQAVTWAERHGRPADDFHEELAATYDALGRTGEAREHSREAGRLRGLLELG